ncbi:MAG: peptidoglycan-binding protein [Blastocatellia bacterium]|nr:peptidoglycan-binding protein [Blastocatellia bacterium]
MNNYHKRAASAFLSLAIILSSVSLASVQRQVTVPVGTIIPLRMDTLVNSDKSSVGDRFTATVFRAVTVGGRVAVPEGAKVEGHITAVTPAERASKAGTLAVAFDRIVFSRGNSIPVDGTLTTLNEEGRRRIEQDIDDESRVGGGSRTRRGVLFIGGGAGAGAVIGAVASGTKGAAVGAGIGAVLGTIGLLLSNGEEAEVQPGAEFGLMVERSFTVDTNTFDRAGDQGFDHNYGDTGITSQDVLSSADSIRAAQIALRDRNFYNGPINGAMNQATRNAIRQFQRNRSITESGYLDSATAHALGIPTDSDIEPTENVFTSSESV